MVSNEIKRQFLLKPKGVEEAALVVKDLPGIIDALGRLSQFSAYSNHPLDVKLISKAKDVVGGVRFSIRSN